MNMVDRKTSDQTIKAGPDGNGGAPALRTTSSRSAPALPVTIAEWPRNRGELVRVRIKQFNNAFTIDIRCWERVGDGVFKPTRNGLTLGVKHLRKLYDTLAQARNRAELWGLVEPVVKRGPEREMPEITARPRRSRRRSMWFNG